MEPRKLTALLGFISAIIGLIIASISLYLVIKEKEAQIAELKKLRGEKI